MKFIYELKNKISNKNGSAIVYVLFIFLIIVIFSTIVITLFDNNLKQATREEKSIEAYYLAYSGNQMAFTALIDNDNELFDQIKDGSVSSFSESDIDFGEGEIDISVTLSTETNYNGWIKIVSTGTLNESNISRTRTMYIDPSNQKNVVWKEH
jgi:type II secretory pathway component PulK